MAIPFVRDRYTSHLVDSSLMVGAKEKGSRRGSLNPYSMKEIRRHLFSNDFCI